jgi:hypothetical protein
MRKATQAEKDALGNLLSETAMELLRIKQRLRYLDAFLRELHTQTKGEQFKVKNDFIWQWFWDSYAATVTNLASFGKAMVQPGGLFGQLNNHLIQFRPGVHKELARADAQIVDLSNTMTDADEERFNRELHDGHKKEIKQEVATCRERLFPGIKPDMQPTQEQMAALKTRFDDAIAELQKERHAHAHRYDGEEIKNTAADLDRLSRSFEAAETILSDLRYIAFGYGFTFDATLHGDIDGIARDLVDQLLIGTINQVVGAVGIGTGTSPRQWYWKLREDRGARLEHEKTSAEKAAASAK